MKKQFKLFFVVITSVLCAAIVIGAIIFHTSRDRIEGCFFRKMYGSIGVANEDDYAMQLNLFCFDEDVPFLQDHAHLMFDNPNVKIVDLSYDVQKVDNDLTVYSVLVTIRMQEVGQHEVTSLIYIGNSEEEVVYPIGKIHFIYHDDASDFLLHGCNTNIDDGKAVFQFSAENDRAFTITDVLTADDELSKYSFEKNVSFTPGEDLVYAINVDSSVSEYDLLVLQPIFEIQFDNANEKQYFSPYMIVFRGSDMTYDEIKEYVR